MSVSCFKIVRPGVIEIKGAYPTSPLMYIRADSLQGFSVNNRASTIELIFVSGFPSKIIDFTSYQMSSSVEILSEFISQKKNHMDISVNDSVETHIKESRRIVDIMTIKDYGERISSLEGFMLNIINNSNDTKFMSSSIEALQKDIEKLREDIETLKGGDSYSKVSHDEDEDADAISEISEISHESQALTPPYIIYENELVSNLDLIIAMFVVILVILIMTIMSTPIIK